MKKLLTTKQQNLYLKIQHYFKEHEQSPTLEELKDFLQVRSINTVVQYLKILEQKGYIIRRKHSKRNIELRNENTKYSNSIISIPVMASVGCDDLSVFVNEQHDEFIEVDSKILGDRKNVVAVRAIGDSMNDANINDGDYVLIESTEHANTGDRVAVIIGDMITVKKLKKHENMMILSPESTNPKYKSIILSNDSKIAGKVICSIPGKSLDITEMVYLKENGY